MTIILDFSLEEQQNIIRNHFIDFFFPSCFCLWAIQPLVPGPSGSECQVWAPSGGMGLTLDTSLVDYSHKFCTGSEY